MKQLILGSQSRDRRELLANLSIPFQVLPSNYEEENELEVDIRDLVLYLAREKNRSVVDQITTNNELLNYPELPYVLITADTMVAFKGKKIGKARNKHHAFEILSNLSDAAHELLTGVVIHDSETKKDFTMVDSTKVLFSKLSEDDINNYLDYSDEWQDRAGAYSLRQRASLFIKRIEGSPSNVIGLPIDKISSILKRCGINVLAERD